MSAWQAFFAHTIQNPAYSSVDIMAYFLFCAYSERDAIRDNNLNTADSITTFTLHTVTDTYRFQGRVLFTIVVNHTWRPRFCQTKSSLIIERYLRNWYIVLLINQPADLCRVNQCIMLEPFCCCKHTHTPNVCCHA